LRYSSGHKERTFSKILDTASRRFRERGINAVSVADLMAAAGLTHGGFYAHFDSKDALVAEVIRHILDKKRALIRRRGLRAKEIESPLEVIARNYLSARHRDNPGGGCPLPLLSAEIARGDEASQRALTDGVRKLVALLAQYVSADDAREREVVAIGFVSTLVGAMLIARATNDMRFSNRILRGTRQMLSTTFTLRNRQPRSRRRSSQNTAD
jgi:TetR/AcrR family transcriptional repressor of nem operon